MNVRFCFYRHLVDHSGGADHVILFLRVLRHVLVHPGGLPATGQPDHHDHLALRALSDARRPPLAALLHAGGKFKALRQGGPRLL